MKLTSDDIRIAMQISLLGEVYNEIRAIAYSYDANKKRFTIRYYLEREPNEYDYTSVGDVMAEFISNFKYSDFKELKEECQFSNLPFSQIDPLDGLIYSRKEL